MSLEITRRALRLLRQGRRAEVADLLSQERERTPAYQGAINLLASGQADYARTLLEGQERREMAGFLALDGAGAAGKGQRGMSEAEGAGGQDFGQSGGLA